MKIDLTEEFPKLSQAPIVEAVIDFRAMPSVPCDQAGFEAYFKAEFGQFPEIQIQNERNHRLSVGNSNQPEPAQSISSWRGVVLHSADKLKITQCQRDGFSFSRLRPYDNWETFTAEALSLWQKYADLTKPREIQRLGVRFINRIIFKPEWPLLGDYLVNAPRCPLTGRGLPRVNFLQSNGFLVAEHNYQINLMLAWQPADGANPTEAIIVDIDVSTTNTLSLAEDELEQKLTQMRWLKNKFFFASLTPNLLESLK